MNVINKKIVNNIFLCICISLIFNNIPAIIQQNFFGGPIGGQLVIYPLFIGYIYTLYCVKKHDIILPYKKLFYKFIGLYMGFLFISLLIGLYNFPYYSDVFAGPLNQIEKIPKVLDLFHSLGIFIDPHVLLQYWLALRFMKSIILESFWCFGTAYLIFLWYKDDWEMGMKTLYKGIVISLVIFLLYGILDAFYLLGNEFATDALSSLNPFIHQIKSNNGWWPPLLWEDQLRSVFSEPSNVGNYIAVVIPLLWGKYLKDKQKRVLFLSAVTVFFVLLSRARTSYAMIIGMFLLMILFLLFLQRKDLIKSCVLIAISILIPFYSSVIFFNLQNSISKVNVEKVNTVTANEVINDNVISLAEPGKRSNGARFALITSNFRVFLEHPLIGVGTGLSAPYVVDQYTLHDKQYAEVRLWILNQNKNGIFASNSSIKSALNEYITRLAQHGIIGLIIFLIPFIFLGIRLLKILTNTYGNQQLNIFTIIFSLISMLVAGCNNSVNVIFAIWLVMGLGYAVIFSERNQDKSHAIKKD